MIIFKNKKDAYLYFPFYWDDNIIEELVKQFTNRTLWIITDDKNDKVKFDFNR